MAVIPISNAVDYGSRPSVIQHLRKTSPLRHPKTMERQSSLNVLEQSRWQPVDADGVLLPPIGFEPILALGPGPVVKRGALAAIVEQRDPISAGRLHAIDMEPDDLARASGLLAGEGARQNLAIGRAPAPQNL